MVPSSNKSNSFKSSSLVVSAASLGWRSSMILTTDYQVFGWGIINSISTQTADAEFRYWQADGRDDIKEAEPFSVFLRPTKLPLSSEQSKLLGSQCFNLTGTSGSSLSIVGIDVEAFHTFLNDDKSISSDTSIQETPSKSKISAKQHILSSDSLRAPLAVTKKQEEFVPLMTQNKILRSTGSTQSMQDREKAFSSVTSKNMKVTKDITYTVSSNEVMQRFKQELRKSRPNTQRAINATLSVKLINNSSFESHDRLALTTSVAEEKEDKLPQHQDPNNSPFRYSILKPERDANSKDNSKLSKYLDKDIDLIGLLSPVQYKSIRTQRASQGKPSNCDSASELQESINLVSTSSPPSSPTRLNKTICATTRQDKIFLQTFLQQRSPSPSDGKELNKVHIKQSSLTSADDFFSPQRQKENGVSESKSSFSSKKEDRNSSPSRRNSKISMNSSTSAVMLGESLSFRQQMQELGLLRRANSPNRKMTTAELDKSTYTSELGNSSLDRLKKELDMMKRW